MDCADSAAIGRRKLMLYFIVYPARRWRAAVAPPRRAAASLERPRPAGRLRYPRRPLPEWSRTTATCRTAIRNRRANFVAAGCREDAAPKFRPLADLPGRSERGDPANRPAQSAAGCRRVD